MENDLEFSIQKEEKIKELVSLINKELEGAFLERSGRRCGVSCRFSTREDAIYFKKIISSGEYPLITKGIDPFFEFGLEKMAPTKYDVLVQYIPPEKTEINTH